MFSSYDRWKLRSPDDERNDEPKCSACEDMGCPECCEPEPETGECTCRLETVHSAMIDPPEVITDPWCPTHGWRDADYELERARDDAEWERQCGWDKDLGLED